MAAEDWPWTEICIDQATLEGDNPMDVIDPVWWIGNIYDDEEVYERSLQLFSRPQRHVWAVCWYEAEVFNGGHVQFFTNSTGIVWRDALQGYLAAGIPEAAALIEESVRRLGATPASDREVRDEQFDALEDDLCDLNDAYFALSGEGLDCIAARVMKYVRANADDFMFHAWVRKPPPILLP